MGMFDIIHFTEASLERNDDEPSVWACFGFYPREVTWTHLVYEAVMYGEHLVEPQKAVVKLRRFRAGTEPFWQSRLDTNAHASGVSSVFTEKTGAGKITFIDQYLAPFKGYSKWEKFCRRTKHYDFRDLKKDEIVLIEPLVSDHMHVFNEDIVLDAFSHFSYIEGNHQSVIAVFKGDKCGNEYHLITPKIYTSQKEINEFFSEHICNDLCSGWNKPYVISNDDQPLFDLPSEHLKLQRQTSVRVQEPGEHALQIRMPIQNQGILRNPTAIEHQDSLTLGRKKVTTIMHAVYVHDDSQNDNKVQRSPQMQNMFSSPYIDNAIRKEKSEPNAHGLKNINEQSSPRTKAKPVRVRTLETQNVRMPKQLNVRKMEKPEIKPKPEIKQKPDMKQEPEIKQKPEIKLKPKITQKPEIKLTPEINQKPEVKQKPKIKQKPEIKPKPKLKRQERTELESDNELDGKIEAQKMAVQDELRARLSNKSKKENQETNPNLNTSVIKIPIQETDQSVSEKPEQMILVPHTDKLNLEQATIHPETGMSDSQQSYLNATSASANDSPVCSEVKTEKKVKSKKSLRKQPALAT